MSSDRNERRNAKRRAQREDAERKTKARCIQNIAVTTPQTQPLDIKVELLLRDGRHVSASAYAEEVGMEMFVKQLEEHRQAIERKRRERQVHELVVGNGLGPAARKAQLRSAYHHVDHSVYPPCFCGAPMDVGPDQEHLVCKRPEPCPFGKEARFRRAAPKCLLCGSSLELHPTHFTRLICMKTECSAVFEKTDIWARLSEKARERAEKLAKEEKKEQKTRAPSIPKLAKPTKPAKTDEEIEDFEEVEKEPKEETATESEEEEKPPNVPRIEEREDNFATNEERVVAILLEHLELVRDHMLHGGHLLKRTHKLAWFTKSYKHWSVAKCTKDARRRAKVLYQYWSQVRGELWMITGWLTKLGPKSKFALPYMKACAKLISDVTDAKGTWPLDEQEPYCALVGSANLQLEYDFK